MSADSHMQFNSSAATTVRPLTTGESESRGEWTRMNNGVPTPLPSLSARYICLNHLQLSSLSIALSSHYLSTYAVLLLVCVTWSIVCAAASLIVDGVWTNDYSLFTQLLFNLPEFCERTFLQAALILSITLLARHISPRQTQQHYAHFWQQFVYPRNWYMAALPVFVSAFLTAYVQIGYLLLPTPILFSLYVLVFVFLNASVWVVGVIWPKTVPHPLPWTGAPITTTSTTIVRKWKVVIATAILLLMGSLPIVAQGFFLCSDNSVCLQYQLHYIPLGMLVSLSLPALVGILFLYHDRLLIRQRLIRSDRVYFVILLTFQLRLPALMYEGWSEWFLPLYSDCSTTLLFRIGALISYHTAFICFQLLIRMFSLLAVTPAHSLAMIFYLQWFEDLMADFTFASVTPFSTLFFVNAAAQTIKCCVRDGNGIRLIVAYIMQRQTAIAPVSDRHRKRQHLDNGINSSTTEPLPAQVSVNPIHLSSPQAASSVLLHPTSTVSTSSLPSFASVLYRLYVQSFDLILTRHQTFLCESCSKCIIITVLLCRYVMPQLETASGWEVVIDDNEKLWLVAGMGSLWGLQFITHTMILYVLGLQKSNLPSYTDAVGGGEEHTATTVNYAAEVQEEQFLWIHRTAEADMTSSPVLPSLSSDDIPLPALASSPSPCNCGSCVLSFPHYVLACQNARLRHDGVSSSRASAATSSLFHVSALFSPALDPCVHPLLNYWSVHRWFFVIQMMHWIWMIVIDFTLVYTDKCVAPS